MSVSEFHALRACLFLIYVCKMMEKDCVFVILLTFPFANQIINKKVFLYPNIEPCLKQYKWIRNSSP